MHITQLVRRARLGKGVPTSRKHVLLTMATYADPDGANCRPSRSSLEADTGLSRRTVIDSMRWLADQGWIIEDGSAPNNAKRWRLNREKLKAAIPGKKDSGGATTEPPGGVTTEPPGGVTTEPPGGATTEPPGGQPSNPTSPNSSDVNGGAAAASRDSGEAAAAASEASEADHEDGASADPGKVALPEDFMPNGPTLKRLAGHGVERGFATDAGSLARFRARFDGERRWPGDWNTTFLRWAVREHREDSELGAKAGPLDASERIVRDLREIVRIMKHRESTGG